MKGTLWCLHGAVGMAADWRGFRLPGWSVKRVDLWRFLECRPMSLPGFGEALNAEAKEGREKAQDGGRRTGAELAGIPSPRRVLMGYSMGGRLALHALLAGEPWDAAILVAPHPGLEREEERAARRASDAEWSGRALSGDWGKFVAAWEGQGILSAGPGMADRGGLAGRRREVARSFVDWSLGAQEPLWGRLPEIACPVLWCMGERDGKFRALGERAAGLLPRSELWVAPGAGHRVPWEAPDAFREKIGEFLERTIA